MSEFLDWVKSIDNYFEYMEIPKTKKVKMVTYKLKGRASTQWDQI